MGEEAWGEAGEVRRDSGTPYIAAVEGSGAHKRPPDQALMVDRGWAWHGHGVCDAFKANDDEAATQ